MLFLISAMTLARKASRWMIGLDPSRQRPSKSTANLSTAGLIGSGKVLLLYADLRNSLAKLMKMMSEVIPLVKSS